MTPHSSSSDGPSISGGSQSSINLAQIDHALDRAMPVAGIVPYRLISIEEQKFDLCAWNLSDEPLMGGAVSVQLTG